jgi:hypothetical protein
MGQHDPYRYIFSYLQLEGNDTKIELIQRKMLEIQRTFFLTHFEEYDYSDPSFQAAYLIAYFPLYIDPIDDLFSNGLSRNCFEEMHCQNSETGSIPKTEFSISTYGGGAEPELLGILKHFNQTCPQIELVISHYLDSNRWNGFREYSEANMIPNYWNKRYSRGGIRYMNLCDIFDDRTAMGIIGHTDVHVMQNCATDLMFALRGVNNYIEYVCKFFDYMKKDSILVGIDVPLFDIPFPLNPSETIDVRASFSKIVRNARRRPDMEIIKSPSTGPPREITPNIVRNHGLLRYFDVKRTVKYHSFVVRKVN